MARPRRILACLPLLLAAAYLAMPAAATAADTPAQARRAELDKLLTALRAAPTEAAAGMLEARIRKLWLESGSPAAVLLLGKGMRNLENNDDAEAVDDFDAVLALEPDLPDAFVGRGEARFGVGDYDGAVTDLSEALKREPRHFVALQTLSRIAEARGDWTGALAAWRKALEIDPHTPGGDERLRTLRTKAEGEGI
jgi:tetratricopeptide (TPR) repeat protein